MDHKSKKLKLAAIHELIPAEILVMIVKKLGFKSISFARLTCKKWKQVIDDFGLASAALGKFEFNKNVLQATVFHNHTHFSAKVSSIIIAGGGGLDQGNIDFLGAISDITQKINLPSHFQNFNRNQSMVIHNDSILFCGGITTLKACHSLVNGSMKLHSKLNRDRLVAPAVSTKRGTFIFGGLYHRFSYEYLRKDSTTWILGNNDIPGGIRAACAIAINSEQEILLIGDRNPTFNKRILKFDVKKHTFVELPSKLNFGRTGHRCAYIPGTQKIIISGGYDFDSYDMDATDSTEILDTENGIVTLANPMNIRRVNHGTGILTINDEDRLAVFGGENAHCNSLDSVETFNTKSQKWEMSDIKSKEGRHGFGFLSVRHEYLSKIKR